jgi:hypothetical protein
LHVEHIATSVFLFCGWAETFSTFGHFTISFNDLAVPVAGLPLQVTRTYDSRAAGIQGDFGVGWTLDIRNVRLQKNRSLSRNWEEYTTGDPFSLPTTTTAGICSSLTQPTATHVKTEMRPIVEKKFKKPLTRFGVIRIFNESLGRKNLRIVSP